MHSRSVSADCSVELSAEHTYRLVRVDIKDKINIVQTTLFKDVFKERSH